MTAPSGSPSGCPNSESSIKLTASFPDTYDNFGHSVAISDDTIVVGATGDDDNGFNSGSVFVFKNDGSTWTHTAKLYASDSAENDFFFGRSVAISEDTVVVGAHAKDNFSGSVYVFKNYDSTWTQTAKISASDAAAGDNFGSSVAILGDTTVVGATGDDDNGSNSGSVYVFKNDGSTWTQTAKLTASNPAAYDYFGRSVAISDDTIVVGAHGDDDNGSGTGSAYVFKNDDSTWTQTAKLTASDPAAEDYFGHTVAISDDTIVVGAPNDDDNGSKSGSVYVFKNVGSTWTQTVKLIASDPAAFDSFGLSVALSEDTIVVSATGDDDNGSGTGSAYVFKKVDSTWTQTAKLHASDPAAKDYFGVSVAISENTIVVGAPYDDNNGFTNSGSGYVFKTIDCKASTNEHTDPTRK